MTEPNDGRPAASAYRRLPGRGHRLMGFLPLPITRTSLWAGADHLLEVRHGLGLEQYRRFYYGEIEALLVQENRNRLIWSLLLGAPMLLCLVVAGLAAAFSIWWLAAVAAVWLAAGLGLLLANVLRGRACTCQLRTGVQQTGLAALSRARQTRRALEILQPLIRAAQEAGEAARQSGAADADGMGAPAEGGS